jgi:hypothetical protein
VDDIGLVVKYCELGNCTRQLECIARDAIRSGSENKVEVEVGKTEVVVFSKRRKVFQAAGDAVVRVGEQTFAINKSATKWVDFWLDTKLSSNLLRIKKAQTYAGGGVVEVHRR